MTRTPASLQLRLWLVLVFGAAFWFLSFALFPGLFYLVGVNHYGPWFLDSFAILASNDALSLGRDPYLPNPLDPFGRPHVYTHWWLHLRDLGLSRGHNTWFGLFFIGTFFIAAVAWLRPRESREVIWYLVLLCSAPVVLAIERGNNDLVIFVLLAPVVPCLLGSRRVVRLFPVFLIAIATGLKFYPAIAGLVLLDNGGGDVRETRIRLLVAGLLLALVGLNIAPDLARFGGLGPNAHGLATFGAINLPMAFGLTKVSALLAGGGFVAVVAVVFLRGNMFDHWTVTAEDRAAWLGFVLGAALLVGCFFTGTNYAYRWVFALWLAPLLWRLPRDAQAPRSVRRLAAFTAALLVVVIWADSVASALLHAVREQAPPGAIVRWADRFFLFEQPVTWMFFACLVGFLAHFGRTAVLSQRLFSK